MRTLKKSLLAISALCLFTLVSQNAIGNQPHWDDGYRIFQDHSPNFVHVEILNVSVQSNKALWFASASDRVEVEARVLKVVRSKDNLQAGMIIPILYNRKAAAGGTFAETPGIPEKGEVLPAFIKIKGDHFVPAARHHTFTPLAEEQLKQMDREAVELSEAQIAALRLPQEVASSLQIDTESSLPLEEPLSPEITQPLAPAPRAEVVQAELPVVPEIAADTPESASDTNSSQNTPELKSEAVALETSTSSNTSEANIEPDSPIIDTGSAVTSTPVKRRTVVVVPPSELRARREQQIQSASQTVPEPVPSPLLQAEAVTPRSPIVESTLSAEPVTEATPESIPTTKEDPAATALTNAEAQISVNNYPVLRAEPVYMKSSEEVMLDDSNATESMDNSMPAEESPQMSEVPNEEPIKITDFTPQTPAPVNEPEPSVASLTETDRTNMQSYADIYLSLRKADDAATRQDFETAKELYQQASDDLKNLKAKHPDFQPFMVEYRIRDTNRKIEQLVLKAPKETAAP